VLALGACFGTGRLPGWATGQLTPEEQWRAKVVTTIGQYLSQSDWEASPWARIGSMEIAPVYLVGAADGTACLIPPVDWALVKLGDRYPCSGKWRMARR